MLSRGAGFDGFDGIDDSTERIVAARVHVVLPQQSSAQRAAERTHAVGVRGVQKAAMACFTYE